ncbi:unnamed protein product [Blepharisma stoltei]|uniref:EGF-like domain-containing protein n=1 Tax=Blepharisma stoltei TaxID=1481888 RepID=A0AAU9JCW7_9CILI|nr:unnamed protein product [Blepharisma stoltei]
MVVVAFILILMFGASAMQDNIIEYEENSNGGLKTPITDPEILNQLFQNNEGSRQEIRSNATEKERKLTPTCTNGQNNCQTCASASYCQQCTTNAAIPDTYGGCTSSYMRNCAIVSSATVCETCKADHYKGCASCSALMEGCLTCSDDGKCTKCDSGYQLVSDFSCGKCSDSNCDTCTGGGLTCNTCKTGYFEESGSCKPCYDFSPNCRECLRKNFCTKCTGGDIANDKGACTFLSIPNCKVVYSVTGKCSTCESGYYLNGESCDQIIVCTGTQYWDGVNKQCQECSTIDTDCTACTSDGKCTSCMAGKILNDLNSCSDSPLTHCSLVRGTDPNYCTKCSTGYISDGAGGCIQSQLQYCDVASDAGTCTTCSSGAAFSCASCNAINTISNCACASQGGSVCAICNDGLSLIAGICSLACSSNCATCSSKDVCTQCNSGYFLYDESATKTSCVSCADSCNLCTNSPNCYKCADLVVQDGSSCRVDKVGYQLSFDSPDVVIDLAHPLSKTVGFDSFTASKGQVSVPTGGWSIKSSTVSQIKVQTDLDETKLPIDITFSFKQNES